MTTLSKSHSLIAGFALQEAAQSDMVHRHGAVVFRHGKVIATGHNHRRSRPPKLIRTLLGSGSEDCTSTHAEADCIAHALQQFRSSRRREKLCLQPRFGWAFCRLQFSSECLQPDAPCGLDVQRGTDWFRSTRLEPAPTEKTDGFAAERL